MWLTRHAESVSQLIGEIGEDTGELTEAGRLYSMTLAKFIKLEQEVRH
jgi:broad specificity phosphatase PhoE